MSERTFSQKEVLEILEKATQIQKGSNKSTSNGLSAAEILQIAKESGIDEDAIINAIHNLETQTSETLYSWLRGTKEVSVSEIINQEISDNDWIDVLKTVRRVTGPVNIIENIGPNYECDQMVDEITYSHLALTSKNGSTRIEYSSNWTGMKFIIHFFLLLVPTIIGIVIALNNEQTLFHAITYGLTGTLSGYGLARVALKGIFEGQKRRAKKVISEIKSRILGNRSPEITIEEEFERSTEAQNTSSTQVRS